MPENPNCDMQKCRKAEGEVKMLPLRGDGNMILCRHCFETEVLHRKMVLGWTEPRLVPFWDDAKPYET